MGNRLEGKVAVVTGAGRGVGRGVALLMAEEGAKVVVNDLGSEVDGTGSSHEPADGVVAEIQARGGEASANYDNIALMDGGEAVIQQAVDQYGQLDVLVNSVGMLRDRMIFQMTPDDWDRVLLNNTKSAFTTCKFAGIVFRQQRSGRVVNMVSDAGLGDVGRSNFSAASEGIVGLTRTVARDLGRYGVTANAILPGWIETPMTEKTFAWDKFAGNVMPRIPARRWGASEDFGGLAVYLMSDASAYHSGDTFVIDGGYFRY